MLHVFSFSSEIWFRATSVILRLGKAEEGQSRLTGSSDPSATSHITSVQFSRLVMTQNSEKIVVMAIALNQGITIQGETDVVMQRSPRTPAAHPIWEPQIFQTREPTTFELMGMIGDLQRSIADLAYGMSAPPAIISHAGNFMLEKPLLLG